MNFRNTAPVQGSLTFELGSRPTIERLSNGVDLYLINVSSSSLVRVDFMFKGGQWLQEKPLQAALSMKMLRESILDSAYNGNPHYFDFKGVSIDVSANMSYCVISLTCLQRYVMEIIPIIVSVFNALPLDYDKFRIAVEQSRRSFEIGMDTIEEQCKRLFYKSLYGEVHPMSRFPDYDDYDSFDIQDVVSYVRKCIVPSNCSVFLTGNITDQLENSLICTLQDLWPCCCNFVCDYQSYEVPRHNKRYTIKMDKPLVQSSIRIGRDFLPRTHSDYIPMTVLTTVLGGYFGSRLMSVVREEKGYSYGIHSVIYQMPLSSTFVVTTETGNDYVDKVIDAVYNEMDILSTEQIKDAELQQVKNYMIGNMLRSYESGFSLSNRIMQLICNGISLDEVVAGSEVISHISPVELSDLAKKYLSPDSMVECVVTSR